MWIIRSSDKLVQNAPAQSEAQKARQAIPGLNEETPWIKGHYRPQQERKGGRGEKEGERERTVREIMGNIGSQSRNALGYTHAAGS